MIYMPRTSTPPPGAVDVKSFAQRETPTTSWEASAGVEVEQTAGVCAELGHGFVDGPVLELRHFFGGTRGQPRARGHRGEFPPVLPRRVALHQQGLQGYALDEVAVALAVHDL